MTEIEKYAWACWGAVKEAQDRRTAALNWCCGSHEADEEAVKVFVRAMMTPRDWARYILEKTQGTPSWGHGPEEIEEAKLILGSEG